MIKMVIKILLRDKKWNILAYRYSKLRKNNCLWFTFYYKKDTFQLSFLQGSLIIYAWPKMSIILSTTLQSVNSFLQAFGLKEARQEKKSQKIVRSNAY